MVETPCNHMGVGTMAKPQSQVATALAQESRRTIWRGEVFWREAIKQFRASGLSAQRFAQPRGLSASTLLRWAQRLESQAGSTSPAQAGLAFLPIGSGSRATLVPELGAEALRVEHASGLTLWLRGAHAQQLMGALVQMLSGGRGQ